MNLSGLSKCISIISFVCKSGKGLMPLKGSGVFVTEILALAILKIRFEPFDTIITIILGIHVKDKEKIVYI